MQRLPQRALSVHFPKNLQRIRRCLPRVDYDRLTALQCQIDLLSKSRLLQLLLLFVPVIIESDLTDSENLRVLHILTEFPEQLICEISDFIRMQTHGSVYEIVLFHQAADLRQALLRRTDVYHYADIILLQ